MKRPLRVLKATLLFSFFGLAATNLSAQAWNPGTATPATNIDRTGDVTIGSPTASYTNSNTALTINSGTTTYANNTSLSSRSETTANTTIGVSSARLSASQSYFANGSLIGVNASGTADQVRNSFSDKTSTVSGGFFTATINNPVTNAGVGTYVLAGMNARLRGSITTYPTNGYVAAVAGIDDIKGSQTWGGYFEGRGYFEDNVGIGTKSPIAKLDVRGNNIFLSPNAGAGFPSQFIGIGESGGDCDIFGFRSQENSTTFINMGIEDGTRPTISWGTTGNLDFDCDQDDNGCGTNVVSFSCPGMFTIDVNGPGIFAGGTYTPADRALMGDMSEISNPMERLQGLRAISFNYDLATNTEYRLPGEAQVGFLADEVVKVIPEAVRADDDGLNAVKMEAIVPFLVEGVKELDNRSSADQLIIEDQNRRIAELEAQLNDLKAIVSQLAGQDASKGAQGSALDQATEAASLGQNVPNPFRSTTRIDYFVPTSAAAASIELVNVDGQIQGRWAVEAGKGALDIPANDLSEGIYLYSLIVDGEQVATRRMVVAR